MNKDKFFLSLIKPIPAINIDELIIGKTATLIKSDKHMAITTTQNYGEKEKHFSKLNELNLRDLAELVKSENNFLSSIGLCALNSYYSSSLEIYQKINAKQIILEKGKGKKVGFIGHFPFIDEQNNNFEELFIFERKPLPGDLLESDIPKYLPEMDVVALTGATISNHSFFDIRKHILDNAFVIMLGPSTPMCESLHDLGVDVISGSRIIDFELTRKDVLNGVEMRKIRGVEKVSILTDL